MDQKQKIELFSACQAVVCDLDGTLYLDDTPFPESAVFLKKIIHSGRQLFYFTNNTSKSKQSYLSKLHRLGFPVNEKMLITAADCTFQYLHQSKLGPEIYLIGNRDLRQEFESRQFICLSEEQIDQGQRSEERRVGKEC